MKYQKCDKSDSVLNEYNDIPIKNCCTDMASILMYNDLRDSITYDKKERKEYLWWEDGDCSPLRYCPCCGKKIELRDDAE